MELWHTGVKTYDASKKHFFNLRSALMWTINDFPAYANLSRWSTKGKFACPYCNQNTASLRLTNYQKECYMSHRRFLPPNHRWRKETDTFDARTEHKGPLVLLSGSEIQLQARDLKEICLTKYMPKKTKLIHESRGDNWNIFKKTKDGIKARKDLVILNIKHSLHPVEVDGVLRCPAAPYTLTAEHKKRLCQFLKDVKMPDGFCSNIGYLIPLATRGLLPNDVYDAVVNLSRFFRFLCQKSLQRDLLEKLHDDIVLALCKMEKIFPPSFFDIMVHLPVHLAFEACLGGPVQYRWMYLVERYMSTLKKYLRNKNSLEGSISESYLVNESMSMCARYLEDQESRDASIQTSNTLSIFFVMEELSNGTSYTYQLGDRQRAHSDFMQSCQPNISNEERDKQYVSYFKGKVEQLIDDSDRTMNLKILGGRPTIYAKKYNSCKINGYKFNTEKHDESLTTQNSGVLVVGNNGAATINYYGVLNEIMEVSFFSGRRVVLFKCRWFDVLHKDRGIKVDKYGYVSINMNRTLLTQMNDPFIMARQAQQVFYSTDMASKSEWKIVTPINPRYYN
ncbi:uncharacterized protein LOC124935335 [Impatiens glandulifera]|uniref:uncharacterized protein LOC124935335 n=1 Tax=Impatiens glandulifera TaxID=253017 RepID=UPI001FB14E3C|nr:uncharacterized protein LOC124935335 [Impatiens glandulifera]